MSKRPTNARKSSVPLLYLDYNCFQRSFDDPLQIRIQMEALACQDVFMKAERGEVRLVWSFMHEDETLLCPLMERKYEVLRLATLCTVRVGPNEAIYKAALSYQDAMGLSAKDAVHLACASIAEVDFFLTCDDQLARAARHFGLEMAVVNPLDYTREQVR
jgi:predicted nucleic acid-binding protein